MSTLPTVELDFDQVKEELINYLSTQSEFQDYDFTGSALNTLMDVCAYLIHYVGVQANFSLRESFLESAQLRKNITARAKEIGYFPSQKKAGRANFTITLDIESGTQPPSVTVGKNTLFTSTLEDGSSIQFVTYADNPLVDTGDISGGAPTPIHRWQGIVYVAQGTFIERDWEVIDTEQRYIIDQEGVDTDFLTVTVRNSYGSTLTNVWEYGNNLTNVGPTTEAYFLKEEGDGVELYFGNNVIGKQLIAGQFVNVEVLVTEGAVSNGLRDFALVADVAGYDRGDFVISNVSAVTDAADRESIKSIQYLAPLSYQRQNRIVTIEDYKTAVLENYSNVKAINAWGGEDAVPPEYGKVFVSVAPVYGEKVSPTTKKSIEEDLLQKFSVVGITPEIVDPEYLYISLNTTVVYNKDRTTTKSSEIASLVQAAIVQFFDDQVFDYNQSFKYSRFLAAVDAAHASIVSSLADVTIGKAFTPIGNTVGTYTIKFYNELIPGTILSTGYLNTAGNTVTFKDDQLGKIDYYVNDQKVKAGVGTVNYTTGIMSLSGFNPNMQSISPITIYAQPVKLDVAVEFNNLAQLATNAVFTEVEVR